MINFVSIQNVYLLIVIINYPSNSNYLNILPRYPYQSNIHFSCWERCYISASLELWILWRLSSMHINYCKLFLIFIVNKDKNLFVDILSKLCNKIESKKICLCSVWNNFIECGVKEIKHLWSFQLHVTFKLN